MNIHSNRLLTGLLGAVVIAAGCAKSSTSTSQAPCPSTAPKSENAHILALSNYERVMLYTLEGHKNYIVKYRNDGVTESRFSSGENRTKIVKRSATIEAIGSGWASLHLNSKFDLPRALEEAAEEGSLEYFEPDYVISVSLMYTDPGVSKQWAHQKVQSAKAWNVTTGSRDVVVGIVDSGTELSHPDLKSNLWLNADETKNGRDDDGNGYVDDLHGWNFVANNANPTADKSGSYHGTHVAGTVGAVGANGIGIVGHAPKVRIMSLKFLDSNGKGSTSNAIRAIDYATKNGARIINASWGSSGYSSSLRAAIQRAQAKGVLFIAAAGNNGNNSDNSSYFPANYSLSNIIAVAATDQNDRLASFSNFGRQSVHVAAPGKSIYSTRSKHSYATLSGTSMAAPLVSGVAATMLAAAPNITATTVKQLLIQSADVKSSLKDKVVADGRLNAEKAVLAAKARAVTGGTPPVTNPPVEPPGGGGGGSGEVPPGDGGGDGKVTPPSGHDPTCEVS